jgi:hypothetical protein
MDSLNFEFFKQVAIFTLKNDLNVTEDKIKRFEEGLNKHINNIGEKMIEISEQEKKRKQQGIK